MALAKRSYNVQTAVAVTFSSNCGSFDTLNRRTRCGFKPTSAQIRPTLEGLMPITAAIELRLQCVALGGSESLIEAQRKVKELEGADCLEVNMEIGAGRTEVDVINGFEDKAPDDGTHYWQRLRENAMENEMALEEITA